MTANDRNEATASADDREQRGRMAEYDAVTATAPATAANVGPGYDVLGLALDVPGDIVTARRVAGGCVRIARIDGSDVLPMEAERNSAGVAAMHTLARAGLAGEGVELVLRKRLPIGSGLGSSASSAAAAAVAVNALFASPLRRVDLIPPCVEAEAAVAGRHADNVAPALLGGLVLVHSIEPEVVVRRLPTPAGLLVVTVTPDVEVPTRMAREAVPASIALGERTRLAADIAGLVAACFTDDVDLFRRCIEDRVVVPARTALIPGGRQALEAGRNAGALAASISGAGPSLFAITHSRSVATTVCTAMIDAFADAGVAATGATSPMDCPGASIVEPGMDETEEGATS